ncbi:MAG: DUF2237 domain-containing protein [Okeania sp. SIO1H5]|uniref:DUF2237 family protein n=1 Tax=Okeania sp. SIO1H5 TaxID=2607777 RepID=UPI0013BBEE02|nr:DUF2237 domain-containing protein [Okeania sp. SIO1H5]NET23852.1 DUF2237 domain-containing protein [Okeania sp. SIO1H5]
MAKNVLGTDLTICCSNPTTGFYRNGKCDTGPEDSGMHTICAVMTDSFLEFSRKVGNDLSTPIPEYHFPGLQAGDRWCLCMDRWREALANHSAPKILLEATHISVLEFIDLEVLKQYAFEEENSW